jgi:hypothetical protein
MRVYSTLTFLTRKVAMLSIYIYIYIYIYSIYISIYFENDGHLGQFSNTIFYCVSVIIVNSDILTGVHSSELFDGASHVTMLIVKKVTTHVWLSFLNITLI